MENLSDEKSSSLTHRGLLARRKITGDRRDSHDCHVKGDVHQNGCDRASSGANSSRDGGGDEGNEGECEALNLPTQSASGDYNFLVDIKISIAKTGCKNNDEKEGDGDEHDRNHAPKSDLSNGHAASGDIKLMESSSGEKSSSLPRGGFLAGREITADPRDRRDCHDKGHGHEDGHDCASSGANRSCDGGSDEADEGECGALDPTRSRSGNYNYSAGKKIMIAQIECRNNAENEDDSDKRDPYHAPKSDLSNGYESEEDATGGDGNQVFGEKFSPKSGQFSAYYNSTDCNNENDGDNRDCNRAHNVDLSNGHHGIDGGEDNAIDTGETFGEKKSPKYINSFVNYELDAHNTVGNIGVAREESLTSLLTYNDLFVDLESSAKDQHSSSKFSEGSLSDLYLLAENKSSSKMSRASANEFSYNNIDEDDDHALNADVFSALRSNMIECDQQARQFVGRKVRLAIAPPKRGSSLMSMGFMGSSLLSVDEDDSEDEDDLNDEDDFDPSPASLGFAGSPSILRRTAARQRSASSSLQGSTRSSASSSLWGSSRSQCSSLSASLRRTAITTDDLQEIEKEITGLGSATRRMDWLLSFKDLDPRYQILEFFNDLSLGGVELFESNGCFAKSSLHMPKILRGFIKSGIFSVWRPTSLDAIRKMITGEGTGKGLDIKGKSAKRGVYSGFVPFLQIHENAHKKKIVSMRKDKRVRVFYPNRSTRDTAATILNMLGQSMAERAECSMRKIRMEEERRAKMVQLAKAGPSLRTQRREMFFMPNIASAWKESMRCLMEDPTLYKIDDYAETSGVYGLDIPEKLFWEGYVVPNDIRRDERHETGRSSMPEFQQMNIDTLRKGSDMSTSDEGVGPRPVLWHGGCGRPGEDAPRFCNPMCPIDLLMAYEENGKVTPVVSDFDCFLLGTRGVKYNERLGDQELSMLSSCVEEIESVLETPMEGSNWTTRWLEVKKKHIDDPAHGAMPLFGYADPRSYSIMKGAVHKLRSNGAVRHGPECFNYGFPQELDEQYLVISDTFDGIPWRYTNAEGLIDILCKNIDEGFTFPLNPKWVLCDPGWRRVYDKLMASQKPNVQDSLSIWYPKSIRDRMDDISAKYLQGFIDTSKSSHQSSGIRADLAQLELQRYQFRRTGMEKIRATISQANLVTDFAKILKEEATRPGIREQTENSGCQARPNTDGGKDERMRVGSSAPTKRGPNPYQQIKEAEVKLGKGIESKEKKSTHGDLPWKAIANTYDASSWPDKSESVSICPSESSEDDTYSNDGKACAKGAKPSPRQRPKTSKLMRGYLKKMGTRLQGSSQEKRRARLQGSSQEQRHSFQEKRPMGQRMKKLFEHRSAKM